MDIKDAPRKQDAPGEFAQVKAENAWEHTKQAGRDAAAATAGAATAAGETAAAAAETVKEKTARAAHEGANLARAGAHAAKDAAVSGYEKARDVASAGLHATKETLAEGWDRARDLASSGFEKARDAAATGVQATKEAARDVKEHVKGAAADTVATERADATLHEIDRTDQAMTDFRARREDWSARAPPIGLRDAPAVPTQTTHVASSNPTDDIIVSVPTVDVPERTTIAMPRHPENSEDLARMENDIRVNPGYVGFTEAIKNVAQDIRAGAVGTAEDLKDKMGMGS